MIKKELVILFIILLSIPTVFAYKKESCIISGSASDCPECTVYNLKDKNLVCASEDSGLISKPSLTLERFNDNMVKINLADGEETAQLTLTTVDDSGLEKPKLDVFLDVKNLEKIPYSVDASFNNWNVYPLLLALIAVFAVIVLILKDMSSPRRRSFHSRRKHKKS
ncbi:MAG TPA: hypothetical protein VJG30_02185 [Candidatus Nanoarchaeia archaeon]|nr:hypothetical protein [Candidatus Nanoarchaeia archaeon]